MLLLSLTSTGHLLSDWRGGKHVLLFYGNEPEKNISESSGGMKRVYKCVDVKNAECLRHL